MDLVPDYKFRVGHLARDVSFKAQLKVVRGALTIILASGLKEKLLPGKIVSKLRLSGKRKFTMEKYPNLKQSWRRVWGKWKD